LSYTRFSYRDLQLSGESLSPVQSLSVRVEIQNVGSRAGDEVVQLYLNARFISPFVPIRQLCGFERVSLAPGETKTVTFTLSPAQMALIDEAGQAVTAPGEYQVAVGGRQPIAEDFERQGEGVLFGTFEIR
jgi:beta-glucosidase